MFYYSPEQLRYVDTLPFQNLSVRIVILDNNNSPLRDIEGRVSAGSISVNGSSSVRRTGSLTIVTQKSDPLTDEPLDIMHQVTNLETLISLNRRARIEIGVENSGSLYPEIEIFWFNLGYFILSSASVSYDQNGIQVSVKLNDKMALLNGEAGGTIPSGATLSPNSDGTVPTFQELLEAILITLGGLRHDEIELEVPQEIISELTWYPSNGRSLYVKQGLSYSADGHSVSTLQASLSDNASPAKVFFKNSFMGVGSRPFNYQTGTAFQVNAGSTVEAALKTIQNTLGDYEFFFDVNGIFHFRALRTGINDGSRFDDLTQALSDKYFEVDMGRFAKYGVYDIRQQQVITAYQNNPKYDAIKNDFNVWGQGAGSLPIHYHAIFSNQPPEDKYNFWRLTYDTSYKLKSVEEIEGSAINFSGLYYKDVINRTITINLTVGPQTGPQGKVWYRPDEAWRIKLYCLGAQKVLSTDPAASPPTTLEREVFDKLEEMMFVGYRDQEFLHLRPLNNTNGDGNKGYWIDRVDTNASLIQSTAGIKDFNIENIGIRTKVINEKKVNCLFKTNQAEEGSYFFVFDDSRYTPHQFQAGGPWEEAIWIDSDNLWYRVVHVVEEDREFVKNNIVEGRSQNPAYDWIRALMHEHLSYNNNITLTTLPMYHFEPNSLITVASEEADINGTYIMDSFTIPLTLSDTMSINARKALQRI